MGRRIIILAAILRSADRFSGAKKAFALPEGEAAKAIGKQRRHRGVFAPTDRKAYIAGRDRMPELPFI